MSLTAGGGELNNNVGREIDDTSTVRAAASVFITDTVDVLFGNCVRIREQLEVLKVDIQALVVGALACGSEILNDVASSAFRLVSRAGVVAPAAFNVTIG